MVNKDQIQQTLKKYFAYHGTVDIDDQGIVSCTGDVQFTGGQKKLPVRFAEVSGSFKATMRKLTTLVGAPHTVGHQFKCWGCPITSLEHAPTKVGAEVYARDCQLTNLIHAPECTQLFVQNNPLVSLEGMPKNLDKFGFTFDPNLPMLKALQAEKVVLYAKEGTDNTLALDCYKILDKYVGQGKPGALKAAAELIRAGLKDTARW
jgi:hypothetical protein